MQMSSVKVLATHNSQPAGQTSTTYYIDPADTPNRLEITVPVGWVLNTNNYWLSVKH